MTLFEIKEMLLTVTPNVFHFEAVGQSGNYIVWAEDSEAQSVHSENQKQILVVDVTVDLYTKDEYSPLLTDLKETFNEYGVPFRLLSIQHESDTKYIHYEFLIQGVI